MADEPEKVLIVGGTNHNDKYWTTASQGPQVDVAAPAEMIWSPYYGGPHSYASLSGTSMAAPQVAALAALLKSANPQTNNAEIVSRIQDTAVDKGPLGFDNKTGHGRINVSAAVLGFGPPGFLAWFPALSGNATKARVHVDANGVDRVQLRAGLGPWQNMTLRPNGDWSLNTDLSDASLVQFRAFNGTQSSESSCFRWPPDPIVTELCEDESFAFAHLGGTASRVKAYVSPTPSRLDAKDTEGTWVPMTQRTDGVWVASFPIEAGHDVRFRAFRSDGTMEKSCWFSHPDGERLC